MSSLVRNSKALNAVIKDSYLEASLWRQLKQDGDEVCRKILFERHRDFALMLSNREFKRRPSYGFGKLDFDQHAYCGLLQAIDRFDPMSGCGFKTFARYRIIGSIADGVLKSSDQASAYHATRKIEQERLRSLMDTDEGKLGSSSLKTLQELVSTLAIGVLIESVAPEHLESVADVSIQNGYESLQFNQVKRTVLKEVEQLPDQQKDVVKRHYLEDMTFTLIAKLLGLSKGRISQLHSSALGRLHDRLKHFFGGGL